MVFNRSSEIRRGKSMYPWVLKVILDAPMVVLEVYHGIPRKSSYGGHLWDRMMFVTGIFNDVPNTIDWR